MDLVTHGDEKRNEKEIMWPSFLRERRWKIALVAMANCYPLERCWQTGCISTVECLQSCTVIISQWLAELIRAFMLISLAAVPKTGGGKYANLGRILMLCITSFNYHKIFSQCPFQDLNLFCPLLFSTSIFPSLRVFSNELVLLIRRPKYWSFSFSISPCNEYSGWIF